MCSGLPTHLPKTTDVVNGWHSFTYLQQNAIPAYLMAVVVGALEKAAIGPRSSVWFITTDFL